MLIFSYLEIIDLVTCSSINRQWRKLLQDDYYWFGQAKIELKVKVESPAKLGKFKSWRQYCLNQSNRFITNLPDRIS